MIKRGDRNNDVLAIQKKLKLIGYPVNPDGMFGPATELIVKQFQAKSNLVADGIIGPKTEQAIDEQFLKSIKYESAGQDETKNGTVVNNFHNGFIYLLDNGHGGLIDGVYQTAGKRSPEVPPGVYEGVANRNIVSRIIDYCEDNNISYANLVPENQDISLGERVRRANQIASHYKNCIYLSVHCNAAGSGWNSANGIETFYKSDSSRPIAEKFQDCLIEETDARDRGIKHANFFVLRKTSMPAILLELGFMTNLEEAKLLRDKDYIDKLAYAIARAMKQMNKRLS